MAKTNYKKFFKNQEVYKVTKGKLLYVFSPYAVVVSDVHNDIFLKEIEGLTFAESSGKEKAVMQFIDGLKDCKIYGYTKSPFVYHDKIDDVCFLIANDAEQKNIIINNRYIEPFEKVNATIQVCNDDKNTVMILNYDNMTFNYVLPIRPIKANQFQLTAKKIVDSNYL